MTSLCQRTGQAIVIRAQNTALCADLLPEGKEATAGLQGAVPVSWPHLGL